MNEYRSPTSRTAARTARLERQDFSAEQVARLRSLKELYPILEFVDSKEQLQRLRFLKWRYAQHRAGLG